MENFFVQVVKEKFGYLVADYGFRVSDFSRSPRDYLWEGKIIYAATSTCIHIECTRGESPSFYIGRIKDDVLSIEGKGSYRISFRIIYEYLLASNNQRNIITSLADRKHAQKIINQEKNINREMPVINDPEKQRVAEIDMYAKLIRKHAEPFLLGDFSLWLDLWEYLLAREIATQLDDGRSEYIDVVVPDGKGKFKIIGKKHIYQNWMDYIDKLKKE